MSLATQGYGQNSTIATQGYASNPTVILFDGTTEYGVSIYLAAPKEDTFKIITTIARREISATIIR